MTLTPRTRIGPYEVTALLGVGGMGEVYRARDTALGREVAIKVLPDAFANDADRLARFDREARTLATLNHPHIAQVYGLERSSAGSALVMELVEGPTLADRIATGPVPLDEAMTIATQVADALEAAHEQGIIHRDLKPANIKVRHDGVVKVLDFGLAKLAGRDGPGSNPALAGVSEAATVTSPVLMTGAGMILGTAAYMAPEQARGRAVDKRADIWAFGCVLFEMLTGKRAFPGEDITETLASVVRDQPDLASIPERARALIARCLEKDPRARLRDLGDRSLLLELPESASSRASRGQWAWPVAALAAFALAGAALWAPWREAPPPADEVSFEITPPPGASFAGRSNIAVSPDGRSVAFKAIGPDRIGHVWIRSVGSTTARMLGATASEQELGSDGLLWSPDSRSLAFNHGADIRRVDVLSGEVRTVCDGCGRASGWSEDGRILVWGDSGPGIMSVPATGGAPSIASTPAAGADNSHRHPVFLPDGRNFVFYRTGQDGSSGIYLGSLDRPPNMQESRRLIALQAASNLAYAPAVTERSGSVLYMDGDRLMALPFDPVRLAVMGEPLLVDDGVGRGGAGYGFFSVSPAGVLVYRRGSDDRTLTWFDRAGTVLGAAGPVQADVSLSSDGLWAAVAARASGLEVLDLRRGLRTRIADGARNGVWSPDGERVAFSTGADSKIWMSPSNGGRPEEAIFEGVGRVTPNDWSQDGRVLLYSAATTQLNSDIWALPIDGDRRPLPVVRTQFNETRAQFSPDGRWVAYESNESSDESKVFVTPFSMDGAKTTQRWTIAGGGEPRWRADGKELFYRNAQDLSMMAVDVSPGPSFKAGTPRRLFSPATGPGPGPTSNAYYDVTPDGQRFLVNTFAPATLAAPITVRLNWRPDRTR